MNMDHEERPGFLLSRLAYLFRIRVTEVLKEAGLDLSVEESSILMVLHEAGEPLRAGDFAKLVMRDITTVTRQVDGLVEKRLVSRERDPNDGRVVLVRPTAKGTKQMKKLMPLAEALRQRLKSGISAQQWNTTIQTMQRMQENLID
ncbi:MarR family winged helix-turn-helix transcriptional regulator [Rhodopirellula sp. P2]|uniref:MarR family winged helix-turn-helix transcriptional regulator n=1 Tax=Rhodopirellula sp. P2 TaxID=2127060 RepID=UPI002367E063|nr:MarR family transcriptional regulator [Rhodopirellula sp. P2]WDQ17807.1 MarR family transcriptional regulator [Rhodopirellula sp. P2]